MKTEVNEQKKIKKNLVNFIDDYELNNLNYEEALKLDSRTFIQIFCSNFRKNHLIMFSFFTPSGYNLTYIKISKFTLLIGTNLAMSVLFFLMNQFIKYILITVDLI